jgi:outer membrane immunogenic protein
VYGTAGAAFADNQHTVTVSPASTVQANQTGWVAGVGVEGRILGNWTAKFEYLAARFDSNLSCPAGPCTFNNFADFVRVNIVRAGVNYRFF